MNRKDLLEALPPYEDEWVLIHPNQTVKDIIGEVLEAHQEFAPYYDKIVLYFDTGNIEAICNFLYIFCKQNIKYKEESEEKQTSALPTGILTRGFGDCKHYSGFIAGILDALNRSGRKIKWHYRFASYNPLDSVPHHVFVVVNDNGQEIWVDPTPNANVLTPAWQVDKKIKAKNMALHRNVSGFEPRENGLVITGAGTIGLAVTTNAINVDNINYDGSGRYAGAFNPYLGLTAYGDYESSSGTDWNALANKINQMIATGPQPGHLVDAAFVQWVFNENIRSWNFFFESGVRPGFTANDLLPATWPRPVFTADQRLIFEPWIAVDDYRNGEIHLLTAWLQDLVNKFSAVPWPVKPREVKEFSQGRKGDNFLKQTRRTADNWLSDIGKAIETAVNFVKEGVLKVIGFAPRNAFLSLVGLNVFHFANHLAMSIANGEGDKMKKVWEDLGGNYDKLYNTIEKGNGKPAIEDPGTMTGETIGEATVAAILAAAAPIIAAMLAFLNKDGKLNPYIESLQTALQTQFPDQNFSFLSSGLVDKTGMPVSFIGDRDSGGPLQWAKDNPIAAAAIAFTAWELVAPKKMRLINK